MVGEIVAMERKIHPRSLVANSWWSASDDPSRVDTIACGEKTLTAQTACLFLHTSLLVEFTAIVRQDLEFAFSPQ